MGGCGQRARQLVLSQDGQKMLVLLHFLFDEEMLQKYCRDEWMKLYDAEVRAPPVNLPGREREELRCGSWWCPQTTVVAGTSRRALRL